MPKICHILNDFDDLTSPLYTLRSEHLCCYRSCLSSAAEFRERQPYLKWVESDDIGMIREAALLSRYMICNNTPGLLT